MPKVQPQGHHGTGRRGHRGPRVGTALSEINVVPLVDVMLVLLIIFMVAAPMMQRGLDVSLPESRRSDQIRSRSAFGLTRCSKSTRNQSGLRSFGI